MTAYERKPNRVDAVLFDRSKGSPEKDGNWHVVVRMLGPYQTDIAMDTEGNEIRVIELTRAEIEAFARLVGEIGKMLRGGA